MSEPKVTNGSIRLSPAVLSVLVTIILLLGSGVALLARMDSNLQNLTKQIERDHLVLMKHIADDTDNVTAERLKQLENKKP
jgi:short-subunit dehydrogenase